MDLAHNAHPTAAELQAFDAGQLPLPERESIERHLAACPTCGSALDTVPEGALEAMLRAFAAPGEHGSVAVHADGDDVPAATIPAELVGHPRYRVLEVLGAGGMGVVYKAIHRHMERVVALKVLNRQLTDRPGFAERFRREVKAAARLAHPNIVTAHDADEADGVHFLVMEYVAGTTLDAEVARRGPLPVREACDLIRQAAVALQHAHERGMVHRDIKPQNLLRTQEGQLKVLDFGLAHVVDNRAAGASLPSGVLIGTPDYVAPEQARDPGHADIRADIYSLGCTLYYLLSGKPPFPSGSVLQKLLAHQQCTPPLLARNDVPQALIRILERMVAKDPAKRYARPGDLATALARLSDPSAKPPAPVRARPWRRTALLATAVVAAVATLSIAICLGVIAVWPVRGSREAGAPAALEPRPAEPTAPAATANPLALTMGDELIREKRAVRNRAADWLGANSARAPDEGLVKFVTSNIDKDFDGAEAFQVLLGAALVRSAKPTLLEGRAGMLHVLELNAAMAHDVPPGAVRVQNYSTGEDRRRAVPRIELSDLEIEGPARLFPERPLTGKVAYRIAARWPGEFALRLTVYFGKRRRSVFMHRDCLPEADQGALSFAFPALDDADQFMPGPDAVFVEIVTQDAGGTVVESNAAVAAVRVMPPEAPRPGKS